MLKNYMQKSSLKVSLILFVFLFLSIFTFNAGEHSIPYQLSFFGVLLVLLSFLFIVFINKKIYFSRIPKLDAIFISSIIIILMIGFVLNIQGVNSKSQLFLILYLIISYVISSYIIRTNMTMDLERSFIYVCFISFIFGLFLLHKQSIDLNFVSFRQEYSLRSNSFFSISTTYGIYLSIGVIFALKQFQITKYKLFLVFVVVFLVGIASTGSRTGMSSLILCLFSCILLYIIRKLIIGDKKLILILMLILSVITMFVFVISNLSHDFISNNILLDRFINGDTNSLGGRTEKIERGLNIFFHGDLIHNLFGFGSDGFAEILKTHYSMSPHSGFIRIFNDFGILFSILIVAYLLLVLFSTSINYLKKGDCIILYDLAVILFIVICETMVNSLFVLSFETLFLVYALLHLRYKSIF